MPASPVLPKLVGERVKRREDPRLIQGRGTFADAEVVISQRMVNQRLAPTAMEPRGVVAHYEPGKGTMTTSR